LRTAIVSDLHLGSSHGEDLLRNAEVRRLLLAEIAGADRLVLLGDALETREAPLQQALAAARPFFEALGQALPGGEVLLVPGNHDHRLAEPLLEARAGSGAALGLELREGAREGAALQIAAWLGEASLEVAYPGAWIREDVYATHGHYMDCHMSLPRIECLAAAALIRAFGPLPDPAAPADYERVLQPLYGFSYGLAQAGPSRRAVGPSMRVWRAISGSGEQGRPLRRAAMRALVRAGVPAGVWSVNRLLRSDFDAALSPEAITRSGVVAATELAHRLRLGAAHVITGHTHRAGPRPEEPAWELSGGGRLHNTGSWTFATAFHRPGTPPGPYWPGTVTWVEEQGPPRRVALLEGHSGESLRGIVRSQRAAR
jgi:calcineurin-like phosphoesterase family protein